MSVWRTSIGNNVRRAGSSFLPRPYCHFALQHGPAPNIAHSFFASSESHLARVGTWAISSDSAEFQTGAQSQLSFRYFAFILFEGALGAHCGAKQERTPAGCVDATEVQGL
jgi:hypothetical protein